MFLQLNCCHFKDVFVRLIAMHSIVGITVMSEHMALHDHAEGDISIRLPDCESHWGKRRIKESIPMRELRLSLNGNNALYLSLTYGLVTSKESRGDDCFDSGVVGKKNTGMALITRELD